MNVEWNMKKNIHVIDKVLEGSIAEELEIDEDLLR